MAVWDDNLVSCQTYLAKLYIDKYPGDMFGWIALADARSKSNAFADALAALRRARTLCPVEMRSFVYSQMGHVYREKGDNNRAAKWYRKAINEKQSQENLVFLGACLFKLEKLNEARDFLLKAVELRPDSADEAFFNLGLTYRKEGQYVEALRYFEKAIRIDPDYVDAIAARGDILKLFKIRAVSKRA